MMYVRFIGDNKVCWTILETGAFYIGSRIEATIEELDVCNSGGGEMPLSESIALIAC